MAIVLIPTRLQLQKLCGGDQGLIRAFELLFFGVQQVPSLEDGVDSNTLAISTLSDLIRPITINLVQPLPAPVSANTSYTLTGGDATEGMKTIFIPSASLVSSAGGPFTLTITTGIGTTISVPISQNGTTISSGDLLFNIHIDSSGNIASKSWEISGSNSNGSYILFYTGEASERTTLSLGTATQLWTYPFPFVAIPDGITVTPNAVGARMGSYSALSATSFTASVFDDTGSASTVPRSVTANGRWRA